MPTPSPNKLVLLVTVGLACGLAGGVAGVYLAFAYVFSQPQNEGTGFLLIAAVPGGGILGAIAGAIAGVVTTLALSRPDDGEP